MSEQDTLTYDQAMLLVVKNADGVTVEHVHASLFRVRLYQAVEQHPACNDVKAHLRGLLLRYRHDRAEALRILQRYGVPLDSVVQVDRTNAQTDDGKGMVK